jgi:hypothetical protein
VRRGVSQGELRSTHLPSPFLAKLLICWGFQVILRVAIPHKTITTAAISDNKKRNLEPEDSSFNAEWTNEYLFTVFRDKVLCLVCRETAAVPKQYNVRRHCETERPEVAILNAHEKKIKAANFVKNLSAEQQIFKKVNTENGASAKVGF